MTEAKEQNLTKQVLSAKSYVKDSLCMMFDAIENAGKGVHDSEAIVWTDLISGIQATSSSKAKRFLDDQYRLTSFADALSFTPAQHLVDAFERGDFTVEVVVGTSSQTSDNNGMWRLGDNTFFKFNLKSNHAADWSVRGDMFKISNGSQDSVFSTVVSGPNVMLYKNGVLCGQGLCPVDMPLSSNEFMIGRFSNAGYVTYCGIRAIRIYNRALAVDEVMHNYEIDKERFGI